MIIMSAVHSIRQMRKRGDSISEVARKTGLSRNTVYAKRKSCFEDRSERFSFLDSSIC
ncbi:helix-turn-helix domain-containing protein [Collinsella sp. HCP3S3_A7]|uniref:helix-turn-helix domain-containing protein n=1 Tax=unclassified Collinsella TaxID=2637548 RepID=UPI003F8AC75A